MRPGPKVLFTRTSRPPKRSAACETRARTSLARVMSAVWGSTSAPVSSTISAAVRARVSPSRLEITTLAPSRASSVATALPSPLLAAITSATRPCRPRFILATSLQGSSTARKEASGSQPHVSAPDLDRPREDDRRVRPHEAERFVRVRDEDGTLRTPYPRGGSLQGFLPS